MNIGSETSEYHENSNFVSPGFEEESVKHQANRHTENPGDQCKWISELNILVGLQNACSYKLRRIAKQMIFNVAKILKINQQNAWVWWKASPTKLNKNLEKWKLFISLTPGRNKHAWRSCPYCIIRRVKQLTPGTCCSSCHSGQAKKEKNSKY